MGWLSSITKQRIEILRFWSKICTICPTRIVRVVNQWSLKVRKSWDNKVLKLLSNLNIPVESFSGTLPNVNSLKELLIAIDHQEWWYGLWNDKGQVNGNKLRTYRQFKYTLAVEPYVRDILYRSDRSILAKLRCGSLPLEIETGRFTNPVTPLINRTCKCCKEKI